MLFETAWTSVMPRIELAILKGHTDGVRGVCSIETAGRTLPASAGGDATVRIWDPATGQQLRVLCGHTGGVSAVLFLDGVLISAGDDRIVRTWDPIMGRQLRVLTGYHGASLVEVDGQAMVASATDGGVALCDPATAQVRQVFSGADTAMSAVQADGRTLVAARNGRIGVGVWDLATSERCWQRQPDALATSGVCSVAAGDRALVASAGYDEQMDGGRVRTRSGSGIRRPVRRSTGCTAGYDAETAGTRPRTPESHQDLGA